MGEGSGWGVRLDVKFLGKFTKKKDFGGLFRGGGIRVGGGGQGGCDRRIEIFGKIQKKWG